MVKGEEKERCGEGRGERDVVKGEEKERCGEGRGEREMW